MKQTVLISLIFFLFIQNNYAQDARFKPTVGVIMKVSLMPRLLGQGSRFIPDSIESYWALKKKDVVVLENNFKNIYSLVSNDCCMRGAKVDSLQKFGFQYGGVIIKGRKYIYINAFTKDVVEMYRHPRRSLSKFPVVAFDGATNFWGVLFDIESKQFSALLFNGAG